MAFAVGVYLPFELNVPIFLGGVVALLVSRRLRGAPPERHQEVERMGLLAAAGFITGEALLGIGLAVPVAVAGDKNALTLFKGEYADFTPPAVILVIVSLSLLYKLALRPEPKRTTPTS
jgi:hypothetical protein